MIKLFAPTLSLLSLQTNQLVFYTDCAVIEGTGRATVQRVDKIKETPSYKLGKRRKILVIILQIG